MYLFPSFSLPFTSPICGLIQSKPEVQNGASSSEMALMLCMCSMGPSLPSPWRPPYWSNWKGLPTHTQMLQWKDYFCGHVCTQSHYALSRTCRHVFDTCAGLVRPLISRTLQSCLCIISILLLYIMHMYMSLYRHPL